MAQDKPLFGIFLMIGFCVLAPLADSAGKILSSLVPLLVIVMFRFGFQVAILTPVFLFNGGRFRFSKRVIWLSVLRTALHITGLGVMFAALRAMPLADTLAIAYVMPFILLFLARVFMNETVGMRRIITSIVGFCGTLLVVQPAFSDLGAVAFLPLLVALIFALFMMLTRAVATEAEPIAVQLLGGLIALPLLALVLIFGEFSGFTDLQFQMPDGKELALLSGGGILGTAAHLLMTYSLRHAPSSTVAPVQYLEIPFATLIGWLVFKEFPNGIAAIGIMITIGAGLFVVWSEHRHHRAAS